MTLAATGAARPEGRSSAPAAMEPAALRASANGPSGSEQQPLRCPRCGAGPFGTPGELEEHIEAVHGNQQ